jgi:hypothetical protein
MDAGPIAASLAALPPPVTGSTPSDTTPIPASVDVTDTTAPYPLAITPPTCMDAPFAMCRPLSRTPHG